MHRHTWYCDDPVCPPVVLRGPPGAFSNTPPSGNNLFGKKRVIPGYRPSLIKLSAGEVLEIDPGGPLKGVHKYECVHL